jgi:hypothetical protein
MSMCCFSLNSLYSKLMFLSIFSMILFKASYSMVVGALKLYLMMTIDLQMLDGHVIILVIDLLNY